MSLAAAVLTFREGLEAALVLAIMLGYLKKVGRIEHKLSVWAGAISAAVLAFGFTLTLQLIGAQFEYPAKGIYEGLTSLLAVVMLSYMIFWMTRHARYIKGSLEQSMKDSFARGASWGLFGVAFLTVAREGVETALFLSASAFQSSGIETLLGGIAGLLVSACVAWAVYVGGIRLNMRAFFKITSILLLIFGAAILRYSIQEFEEVGWIPPVIDQVWNTAHWLPNSSGIGAVLNALAGYTSKPSLMQIVGYFGYLLVLGVVVLKPAQPARISVPALTSTAADTQSGVLVTSGERSRD